MNNDTKLPLLKGIENITANDLRNLRNERYKHSVNYGILDVNESGNYDLDWAKDCFKYWNKLFRKFNKNEIDIKDIKWVTRIDRDYLIIDFVKRFNMIMGKFTKTTIKFTKDNKYYEFDIDIKKIKDDGTYSVKMEQKLLDKINFKGTGFFTIGTNGKDIRRAKVMLIDFLKNGIVKKERYYMYNY